MTGVSTALAELQAECDAQDIRLAVSDADSLEIDAPQGTLTPGLLDRLRSHKAEVLAILRSADDEFGTCEACSQKLIETPTFDGFLNLECPGCGYCFGCRPSTGDIAARFAGRSGIPVVGDGTRKVGDVNPCRECGSVDLWLSVAGDPYGLTAGRWRCKICNPPTGSQRMAEAAERIRRSTNKRTNDTRQNG